MILEAISYSYGDSSVAFCRMGRLSFILIILLIVRCVVSCPCGRSRNSCPINVSRASVGVGRFFFSSTRRILFRCFSILLAIVHWCVLHTGVYNGVYSSFRWFAGSYVSSVICGSSLWLLVV